MRALDAVRKQAEPRLALLKALLEGHSPSRDQLETVTRGFVAEARSLDAELLIAWLRTVPPEPDSKDTERLLAVLLAANPPRGDDPADESGERLALLRKELLDCTSAFSAPGPPVWSGPSSPASPASAAQNPGWTCCAWPAPSLALRR